MEWMDKLKMLMYNKDTPEEISSEINQIIYLYDKNRAKNEKEILNAGKEWEYRLKKYCDIKANLF